MRGDGISAAARHSQATSQRPSPEAGPARLEVGSQARGPPPRRGDGASARRGRLGGAAAAERHGGPRPAGLAPAMRGEVKVLRGARTSDVALLREGRDAILEHEQGWLGLDDVGELYATAAIASNLLGEADQAAALLLRFAAAVHPSWTMAGRWLSAAGDVVRGHDVAQHLEWLREHNFVRAAAILAELADATFDSGTVRTPDGIAGC